MSDSEHFSTSESQYESLADSHEIQRAYNVWNGLYQECCEGYLRLEGLNSQISEEGIMEVSQPNHVPKLTVSYELYGQQPPSSVFVSYVPEGWLGESDHIGDVIDVELRQDGQLSQRKVYETVMNKHGKALDSRLKEIRYLMAQDISEVNGIFDELQTRRKDALESRVRQSTTKPSSWLGRLARKTTNR